MPKAVARVVNAIKSAAAQKAWDTMRSRGGKHKSTPKKPTPKLGPQVQIKLPKNPQWATAEEMMVRTVVLVLTFSGIGNRRKVDTSQIELANKSKDAEVDKEWLNLTKKLIDAEELEAISSLDGEARRFVETRALPSTIKRGVYLLPTVLVEEVNAKLKEYQQKRKPLVGTLVSKLKTLKTEAKARLKQLYDEADYPTPEQLNAAFVLTWRYLYVDSAKNLESVSKEIYDEERKKAEASWAETRETIKLLLRSEMKTMVDHLVERLEPNEHGEKKSFRESSIDKMMDFLNVLPNRNIVNDEQLQILAEQAKSLITKTDVSMLRSDDTVRNYVRHGFETIQALLNPMVAEKPHRRLIIED